MNTLWQFWLTRNTAQYKAVRCLFSHGLNHGLSIKTFQIAEPTKIKCASATGGANDFFVLISAASSSNYIPVAFYKLDCSHICSRCERLSKKP